MCQGASLPMFGGTVWAQWSQRSTDQVNLKMFAVACLLFLLGTVVRVSSCYPANGQASQRLIACRCTAFGDPHHEGHGGFAGFTTLLRLREES